MKLEVLDIWKTTSGWGSLVRSKNSEGKTVFGLIHIDGEVSKEEAKKQIEKHKPNYKWPQEKD